MDSQIVLASLDSDQGDLLLEALENGKVLHFPALPFALSTEEKSALDPSVTSGARKNISLNPQGGALRGMQQDSAVEPLLRGLIERYARAASGWVHELFPAYRGQLRSEPTSLRLHQAAARPSSWRKDDSRLHVDAFPSRPNHGQRILRVFMNIHPQDQARVWRVGEPFPLVAKHFLPRLPRQWPGSAWALRQLHITKSLRSPYDHLMLSLHDAMKADLTYQQACAQESIAFAPGAGWICFSDQASHAVMSGQFMLEQTFFLPADKMVDPERAPLSTLQRLTGRTLI